MPDNARIRFEPDGTVSVMVGKVELGQGIVTALAQIAADELGVPLDRIRMLPASTAYSPDEGVTSGSIRSPRWRRISRTSASEMLW